MKHINQVIYIKNIWLYRTTVQPCRYRVYIQCRIQCSYSVATVWLQCIYSVATLQKSSKNTYILQKIHTKYMKFSTLYYTVVQCSVVCSYRCRIHVLQCSTVQYSVENFMQFCWKNTECMQNVCRSTLHVATCSYTVATVQLHCKYNVATVQYTMYPLTTLQTTVQNTVYLQCRIQCRYSVVYSVPTVQSTVYLQCSLQCRYTVYQNSFKIYFITKFF